MEGDAGSSQLNPTDSSEESDALSAETQEQPAEGGPDDGADGVAADGDTEAGLDEEVVDERRPERLGRGWVAAICAGLLIVTAGVAFGGYQALHAHDQSAAAAREDAIALARAKECVTATQAPDVATLTASQSKIIECATGDFAVQANLFTGILVEAYQAANVAVQVSDLHGAVEKHNDDGSVDVLVAVRVKVTNSQAANQEQGYRLRVKMAPADGTYKVARLDQVTS
jgi:Mce-associated membrane protein